MIEKHAFVMDFLLFVPSDVTPDFQEIPITQITTTVQIIEFIRYDTVIIVVFQFDEIYPRLLQNL